jgi:hypothetical protein
MTSARFNFYALRFVDQTDAWDDRSLKQTVARLHEALASAIRAAEARCTPQPVGFVGMLDGFTGLAFARELYGDATLLARPSGLPIVGCDSRDVIATALAAVHPAGSRALLDARYDERTHCAVVVLRRATRVLILDRDDLLFNLS